METISKISELERDFGDVELLEDMSNGLKNKVLRVIIGGIERVLKIFHSDYAKYMKFETESSALDYFGQRDLSPMLIHKNPDSQLVIMTLETIPIRQKTLSSEGILSLMERIHSSGYPAEYKDNYLRNIITEGLDRQRDSLSKEVFKKYIKALENINRGTLVPSHGDYRINNLVERNGRLLSIDWENVLLHDSSFDISSMISSLQFEGNHQLAKELFKKTLGKENFRNLPTLLGSNYVVYGIYHGIYRNKKDIKEKYLSKALEVISNGLD